MTFKKLALASAVALVPASSFAMEEMADNTMSDVTGQDGILISLSPTTISMDIGIHDKDGLSGAAANSNYSFDGGILIRGMQLQFATALNIAIDAGANAASNIGGVLNINVALPNPTTIVTGALYVGNSGRDEAAASAWLITNLSSTIMDSTTIVLGSTTMNIQLGNEPQGNMIALTSDVTNGVVLNNFSLNDANSGGGIKASSITILDNNGTNLSLNVGVNATAAGLALTLGKVGTTLGMDIRIVDMKLGSTTAAILGDVSITGLNINGTTLTISGNH